MDHDIIARTQEAESIDPCMLLPCRLVAIECIRTRRMLMRLAQGPARDWSTSTLRRRRGCGDTGVGGGGGGGVPPTSRDECFFLSENTKGTWRT